MSSRPHSWLPARRAGRRAHASDTQATSTGGAPAPCRRRHHVCLPGTVLPAGGAGPGRHAGSDGTEKAQTSVLRHVSQTNSPGGLRHHSGHRPMCSCAVVAHATPSSNADCWPRHSKGVAATLPDQGENRVWNSSKAHSPRAVVRKETGRNKHGQDTGTHRQGRDGGST